MIKSAIVIFLIMFANGSQALPDEEKQRTCKETSRSVLPVQRETALARCIEFANNECDRIERSLNETCIEGSHSDNAIKYDLERSGGVACEAAMIKRDTQKIFCDGLRKECRESRVAMGGSGAFASCTYFRNEEGQKLCAEVERHANRIIELERQEKLKCPAAVKSKSN